MNWYELCQLYFITDKADREGGVPLEMAVDNFHPNGFTGRREPGINKFFAPCVYYSSLPLGSKNQDNGAASPTGTKKVVDLWL